MKTRFAIIALLFLPAGGLLLAATPNESTLRERVRTHLPQCQLRLDATGKVDAVVSPSGEILELAKAARDHPTPTNSVVGYWFTPTMDFLSRQNPGVGTAQEAVGLVQLMHELWQGPKFVRQKLYEATAFDGGWVVQVNHDFTNYPGNIRHIPPYELTINGPGQLVQFRERCYSYPGSAQIYTNTVISVYEREIKINRGRDFPEALFKELRTAWEEEQKPVRPEKPRGAL